MTQIKLDRNHYHKTHEIEDWLRKNIGRGTWYAGELDHLNLNMKWTISQMFGYTTITFRDDKDAIMFTLKWT